MWDVVWSLLFAARQWRVQAWRTRSWPRLMRHFRKSFLHTPKLFQRTFLGRCATRWTWVNGCGTGIITILFSFARPAVLSWAMGFGACLNSTLFSDRWWDDTVLYHRSRRASRESLGQSALMYQVVPAKGFTWTLGVCPLQRMPNMDGSLPTCSSVPTWEAFCPEGMKQKGSPWRFALIRVRTPPSSTSRSNTLMVTQKVWLFSPSSLCWTIAPGAQCMNNSQLNGSKSFFYHNKKIILRASILQNLGKICACARLSPPWSTWGQTIQPKIPQSASSMKHWVSWECSEWL